MEVFNTTFLKNTIKRHNHCTGGLQKHIFSTPTTHKGKWGTDLPLPSFPFTQVKANATLVLTTLGVGKHWHLGLVIPTTKYACLIPAGTTNVPVTLYIWPIQPATFVPNGIAAVNVLMRRDHDLKQKLLDDVNRLERMLIQQVKEAVNANFFV